MAIAKTVVPKDEPKLVRVKVTAKVANFRRIGRAWPDTETDAEVTEDQLQILKSDKMLVVHVVPETVATKATGDEI